MISFVSHLSQKSTTLVQAKFVHRPSDQGKGYTGHACKIRSATQGKTGDHTQSRFARVGQLLLGSFFSFPTTSLPGRRHRAVAANLKKPCVKPGDHKLRAPGAARVVVAVDEHVAAAREQVLHERTDLEGAPVAVGPRPGQAAVVELQ